MSDLSIEGVRVRYGRGRHGHLAVRQLPLHALGVDRGRLRHADRHLHEHAAAALADLLEQRQTGMADGVGDRATGGRGGVEPVDVDAHPKFQDHRLPAHGGIIIIAARRSSWRRSWPRR